MARVTFTAEGIKTLAELQHFVEHVWSAGFPPDANVGAPVSGLAGGRLSVSTGLHLLPETDDE